MTKVQISEKNVSKLVSQFNLGHLTTGRAPIAGLGWQDVDIDEDFYNDSIEQIVILIAGRCRQHVQDVVRFTLRNTPIYAHFFNRFFFSKHTRTWEYITGQDFRTEIAKIRKALTA